MFNIDELKVRRRAWMKSARISEKFKGWLLEDCIDTSSEDMTYINSWMAGVKSGKVIRNSGSRTCGHGLILYGEPGRGKTTLAVSIIQEMMVKFPLQSFDPPESGVVIRPCYFMTFNELLDLKGEMMDSPTPEQETLFCGVLGECLNDSYNIRILVLDDLGKEHSTLTGWQKSLFHHVIRTRFNRGLPTIITTNIEPGNWAGLYGDATASFANEAFTSLIITPDRGDLRV